MKKFLLLIFLIFICLPVSAKEQENSLIKIISRNKNIKDAVTIMNNPISEDSYYIITGNNPSNDVIKISFKNLGRINKKYADYDALGWGKNNRLYIYINKIHKKENAFTLSALLSGMAVYTDKDISVNETIYAWAKEGATWAYYTKYLPELNQLDSKLYKREKTLAKLYEKSPKNAYYIKKAVEGNTAHEDFDKNSKNYTDKELNTKLNILYNKYKQEVLINN